VQLLLYGVYVSMVVVSVRVGRRFTAKEGAGTVEVGAE
jgi:hypothetical protein